MEGQQFTIITDHASLEYIKSQHTLSRRQARWLETLQSVTYEVKYKSGKTNVVADALSRIPNINSISVLSTLDLNNLTFLYQQDPYFAPILETLQNPGNASEKSLARAKHFELQRTRIYLKEGNRFAIPKDKRLRTQLLKEHHDIEISEHLEIDKTYESL